MAETATIPIPAPAPAPSPGAEAEPGSFLDDLAEPTPDQLLARTPEEEAQHELLLEKIRKKVESFFTDESLGKRNGFIFKKLGGAQNKPVQLKLIAAFGPMRGFRYRDIIDSIKKSDTLLLTPGEDYIRMKEPLSEERAQAIKQVIKLASKEFFAGRRGNKNVTGFEEWYADAPTTPKEYQEERELYDPDKAISLRLSAAVYRYSNIRKFHNHELNIFSSFLRYGGWESTERQHTGKDVREYQDGDPLDRALMLSTLKIDADMDDPSEWTVNFERVFRGYFSSYFLESVRQTPETPTIAANIFNNFLNYLLHHDVCNEYRHQMLAARVVIARAALELPGIGYLQGRLPDNFSIALSVLTDGHYGAIFGHTLAFMSVADVTDDEAERWGQDARMNRFEALNLARVGLRSFAPDQLAAADPAADAGRAWPGPFFANFRLRTLRKLGLEIVAVLPPTADAVAAADAAAAAPAQVGTFQTVIRPQPLGALRCRRWRVPRFADDDLPPGLDLDRAQEERLAADGLAELLIPLDATRLAHLRPGMKLIGNVTALVPRARPAPAEAAAAGAQPAPLAFFDQLDSVLPSFYTLLLNDLELADVSAGGLSRQTRQGRELVWHDAAQTRRWERDELRSFATGGVIEDADLDEDGDGPDGAGAGAGAARAADGAAGSGKKKRKNKKKSKKKATVVSVEEQEVLKAGAKESTAGGADVAPKTFSSSPNEFDDF